MFCRKCGKEIPAESKFCNSCGEMVFTEDIEPAELDESAFAFTPDTEAEPNGSAAVKKGISKKSKIVIISSIAAVITASAAAGLFILLNQNDGKKIADAFENTFGAESYKCTLTSYCLNDDGIEDEDPVDVYIEHFRNDDECLFYYKTDGDSDNNYGENVRLAYENGDWYIYKKNKFIDMCTEDSIDILFDLDTYIKYRKSSEKFRENVNKSPYHALTCLTSKSYMGNKMDIEDNTGMLRYVMSASAAPQLKNMLNDYFKDNKSVDCIKEYNKKGEKYSFKIDYGQMIKSLEVDYNKKVKNNVVDYYSYFENADKYKYTLTVDVTLEKEYVKNIDIDMFVEVKGSDLYAKIGKWTFEFDKVNNLKAENCKVNKVKIQKFQEAEYYEDVYTAFQARTAHGIILEYLEGSIPPQDLSLPPDTSTMYLSAESVADIKGEIDCSKPDKYNGKTKKVAHELKENEFFGIVYIGTNNDGHGFVQWRENKDSNAIGQYPAPNNPEGNVIWGVYS